jgi:hypothetical protein
MPPVAILAGASPGDTFVKITYLPIHRALLALNHNDSSAAIECLQAAGTYDLAIPGSWYGFFGMLCAPYLKGQAILASHRYTEVEAEFKKILDRPGIVFTDPVRALARLQLARTLELAGDRTRARMPMEAFQRGPRL